MGIITLILIIIEIAIPIGILILIILGIKALHQYLKRERAKAIIEDEIYQTTMEVNEIEKELNSREDLGK